MTITAPPARTAIAPRFNPRMSAGVSVGYGMASPGATRDTNRVRSTGAVRRGPHRRTRPSRNGLRYSTAAAVGFVAAFLVLFLPGMEAQADRGVSETAAQSIITVQPGDSLWSVASRVMPDVDPRSGIEQLREANGLSSAALTPGQELVVPTR